MGKLIPPPEEPESGWEHPSQSHANRHPLDQLLRRHGHRREEGEAVWERDGLLFAQSQALERVPQDDLAPARPRNRGWWIDEQAPTGRRAKR